MLDAPRNRSRSADLVAAEWLLRVGAVGALLTAVALLLGTNGLGVVSGSVPLLGSQNSVMSERTEITGAEGLATVTAVNDRLGPLEQRTDAAARPGGTERNWAEAAGPTEVTVQLWNPTTTQRWAWTLVRAVPALAAGLALWLLAGVAWNARQGDAFTRDNVRRLQAVTGLTLLAGLVGEWGTTFVRRWLLDSSDLGRLVPVDFDMSFAFLGLVAVLAVVTTVWRRGVAMREDLEGLV